MTATTALDDPFFQVPRTTFETSEGPVELPILYFDASALYAFFLPRRSRVEALLAGRGLVPALTMGDRAIAALACFEYRSTTVGRYNEVGLAVAVCREGKPQPLGGWPDLLSTQQQPEARHVAFHVLDLPVTTAAANAAGREIWGYPKFVTDISFHLQGHDFSCSVLAPGASRPIVELAGRMGPSIPAPPMSMALLSHRNGDLVRATVNARGATHLASAGSLRLSVPGREHPMGQHLEALGLDGARPKAVMWTHAFQSRLNAGAVVQGALLSSPSPSPPRPTLKPQPGPVPGCFWGRGTQAASPPPGSVEGHQAWGSEGSWLDGRTSPTPSPAVRLD